MCCSRKYPYPSHERSFGLELTRLEFQIGLNFFWILAFETPPPPYPSPSEFPKTFHGVGVIDIFWNHTLSDAAYQQN